MSPPKHFRPHHALLALPLALFLLSSCTWNRNLIVEDLAYNFEGVQLTTGNFVYLEGPRGKISCPKPDVSLLTTALKNRFDLVVPQITEILRADLPTDKAFSQIVYLLPNHQEDLQVLDYRLCVNYANGLLDGSLHQRFIDLATAQLQNKMGPSKLVTVSPSISRVVRDYPQKPHKSLNIAIIKGTNTRLQDSMALAGFVRRARTLLAANGLYPHFEVESNLTQQKDDKERESAMQAIFRKFDREKPDYIVSIATSASEFANRHYRNKIPIIFIGVGDPIRSGLVNSEKSLNPDSERGEIAGTTFGIPFGEWTDLIFAGFHDRKIGFVYKETTPGDVFIKDKVMQAASDKQPHVQFVPLAIQGMGNNMNMEQLEQADIFFGWNYLDLHFADLILGNKKPFIAGTENLIPVAAITMWADNYRIGEIAAEDILFQHLVMGIKLSDLPIAEPRLMRLAVNKRVAKQLQFEVPDYILQRANLIIE